MKLLIWLGLCAITGYLIARSHKDDQPVTSWKLQAWKGYAHESEEEIRRSARPKRKASHERAQSPL